MIEILIVRSSSLTSPPVLETPLANDISVLEAKGIAAATRLASEKQPVLIVCDGCPREEVWNLSDRLSREPRAASIPLLILSLERDTAALFQKGKESPFTASEALQAISNHLARRHEREKPSEDLEGLFTPVARLKELLGNSQSDGRREGADISSLGIEDLAKQVEGLTQLVQSQADVFHRMTEDLRQTISKINMAIYLLKRHPAPEQGDRYLDVLQEECEQQVTVIGQFSELHNFLTPENLSLLRRFKILGSIDATDR